MSAIMGLSGKRVHKAPCYLKYLGEPQVWNIDHQPALNRRIYPVTNLVTCNTGSITVMGLYLLITRKISNDYIV